MANKANTSLTQQHEMFGLGLSQRRIQLVNVNPTLRQRLVFAGDTLRVNQRNFLFHASLAKHIHHE